MRYAKLLDLADGKGVDAHMKLLVAAIKPGDILFTQVMAYDAPKHEAVLELEKSPTISGGLIAIDKGEVRAVVSGFDTLGYNRAVTAKRQPGSVFKSLVLFAGLQLGWSALDRIENIRQIFPFQSKFYYPRPDHRSPYENIEYPVDRGHVGEPRCGHVRRTSHRKLNFDQFKNCLVPWLCPRVERKHRTFVSDLKRKQVYQSMKMASERFSLSTQ